MLNYTSPLQACFCLVSHIKMKKWKMLDINFMVALNNLFYIFVSIYKIYMAISDSSLNEIQFIFVLFFLPVCTWILHISFLFPIVLFLFIPLKRNLSTFPSYLPLLFAHLLYTDLIEFSTHHMGILYFHSYWIIFTIKYEQECCLLSVKKW